jgi:hypothetical protein
MLKYKLSFEGSAKEIEEIKKCGWQITAFTPSGAGFPIFNEEDVEYKIRPTMFVTKTLSELAAEFGANISLNLVNDGVVVKTSNGDVMAYFRELGIPFGDIEFIPNDLWKRVFVKEV